jgi:hypothetical protein
VTKGEKFYDLGLLQNANRKMELGNRYLSAKTNTETAKFFTSLQGECLLPVQGTLKTLNQGTTEDELML